MNLFVRVARSFSSVLGVLAVAALAAACNTPPTQAPDGGAADVPQFQRLSSDILGPGDIVIITFSGATEPPPRHEDRIREDGFITLPFVGAVKASDKTRAELQMEIHGLYVPKYFRQLTVNVNSDHRSFHVSGEVKLPGRILYNARTTVLKGIAAAGDFTDFANPKKVEILRANGKKVEVNCLDARRNPNLDVEIYPDDYIYVPRRWF